MKYVLFVCNHNAGRSQMAQAFFERHAPADIRPDHADDIRADRTAHGLRLQRLLPPLVREFEGLRTPGEIRACADAILARYDVAPVRSFLLTLAARAARDCLREDVRSALAVHHSVTSL